MVGRCNLVKLGHHYSYIYSLFHFLVLPRDNEYESFRTLFSFRPGRPFEHKLSTSGRAGWVDSNNARLFLERNLIKTSKCFKLERKYKIKRKPNNKKTDTYLMSKIVSAMKITVIKGMDNVSIGRSWIPDYGFIHCRTHSHLIQKIVLIEVY